MTRALERDFPLLTEEELAKRNRIIQHIEQELQVWLADLKKPDDVSAFDDGVGAMVTERRGRKHF